MVRMAVKSESAFINEIDIHFVLYVHSRFKMVKHMLKCI